MCHELKIEIERNMTGSVPTRIGLKWLESILQLRCSPDFAAAIFYAFFVFIYIYGSVSWHSRLFSLLALTGN